MTGVCGGEPKESPQKRRIVIPVTEILAESFLSNRWDGGHGDGRARFFGSTKKLRLCG